MRVLFVAWRDLANPNAGGSEVVVDRLARELVARRHEVELLAGGPVVERPYPVRENRGTYSQYLAAPVAYLRHYRNADLVVDVINGMPFFSPLWRRGPRLAMLFHVHTDQWAQYFPAPVASACATMERVTLPNLYRGTRFVTISESSRVELAALGVDRNRIHVLDLGADLEAPDPAAISSANPAQSEPVFVALGRLAPNKRLDLLLDHWAKVAPHTGGSLVFVGDGPEASRLAARVAIEPALTNVVFAGRVSEAEKTEILARASLLVHTAEREGWGLVIIEAGRCGTPTLAYRVPGVQDAVVDGSTGVLVDADHEFVDEWIALGTTPARLAELGQAARVRADEFTWDRTIEQFLDAATRAKDDFDRRHRGMKESAVVKNLAAVHHPLAEGPDRGIARSVHLVKLFRKEAAEPDRFYHYLAADTLRHVQRYVDPAGGIAVDIGGGPGYTAEALRAAGAHCLVVEYNFAELGLHDRKPDAAVQGDGQVLPLRDGSAKLVHSSNVLEHVPDWEAMLSEMVRVLDPESGVGYLNFTNWYSPWGGHETSPWHYLGGDRAVRRFTQRYGRRPKNEFGVSLYELHIAQVLDWFRARADVEVLWVGPRYWPEWAKGIARVRGIREVITWNLVVVFRKSPR